MSTAPMALTNAHSLATPFGMEVASWGSLAAMNLIMLYLGGTTLRDSGAPLKSKAVAALGIAMILAVDAGVGLVATHGFVPAVSPQPLTAG